MQIWLLTQDALICVLDVCLYRSGLSACYGETWQLCVDDVEWCPHHLQVCDVHTEAGEGGIGGTEDWNSMQIREVLGTREKAIPA